MRAHSTYCKENLGQQMSVCVCACVHACILRLFNQVSGALCNAGLSLSTPDLSINLVAVIHHLFLLHTASLQGMG